MAPFGPGRPEIETLKRERDVERLARALGNTGDAGVRKAAARALGEVGDPRAVEPLIAALGDPDRLVREAATGALGKIGDPRAVEPLVAELAASHERDAVYVREAAVTALADEATSAAINTKQTEAIDLLFMVSDSTEDRKG